MAIKDWASPEPFLKLSEIVDEFGCTIGANIPTTRTPTTAAPTTAAPTTAAPTTAAPTTAAPTTATPTTAAPTTATPTTAAPTTAAPTTAAPTTVPVPTYAISYSPASVGPNGSFTVTITHQNVPNGTTLWLVISQILHTDNTGLQLLRPTTGDITTPIFSTISSGLLASQFSTSGTTRTITVSFGPLTWLTGSLTGWNFAVHSPANPTVALATATAGVTLLGPAVTSTTSTSTTTVTPVYSLTGPSTVVEGGTAVYIASRNNTSLSPSIAWEITGVDYKDLILDTGVQGIYSNATPLSVSNQYTNLTRQGFTASAIANRIHEFYRRHLGRNADQTALDLYVNRVLTDLTKPVGSYYDVPQNNYLGTHLYEIEYTIATSTEAQSIPSTRKGTINVSSPQTLSFLVNSDGLFENTETATLSLKSTINSTTVLTSVNTQITNINSGYADFPPAGIQTGIITARNAGTQAVINNGATVNEGDTIRFKLAVSNVPFNTEINYTISGLVGSADLVPASLTGKFVLTVSDPTINGYSGTVDIEIKTDALTEGTEQLILTCGSPVNFLSFSLNINDTSLTQTGTATLIANALGGSNYAFLSGNYVLPKEEVMVSFRMIGAGGSGGGNDSSSAGGSGGGGGVFLGQVRLPATTGPKYLVGGIGLGGLRAGGHPTANQYLTNRGVNGGVGYSWPANGTDGSGGNGGTAWQQGGGFSGDGGGGGGSTSLGYTTSTSITALAVPIGAIGGGGGGGGGTWERMGGSGRISIINFVNARSVTSMTGLAGDATETPADDGGGGGGGGGGSGMGGLRGADRNRSSQGGTCGLPMNNTSLTYNHTNVQYPNPLTVTHVNAIGKSQFFYGMGGLPSPYGLVRVTSDTDYTLVNNDPVNTKVLMTSDPGQPGAIAVYWTTNLNQAWNDSLIPDYPVPTTGIQMATPFNIRVGSESYPGVVVIYNNGTLQDSAFTLHRWLAVNYTFAYLFFDISIVATSGSFYSVTGLPNWTNSGAWFDMPLDPIQLSTTYYDSVNFTVRIRNKRTQEVTSNIIILDNPQPSGQA